MAGDWLKVEIATSDKPEVWQIAEALSIDPDAVVGKLIRVWAWFDQQTVDGNAGGNATSVTNGNGVSVTKSATMALLDRKVGVTGFCAAMISVGWMLDDGNALTLPNFDRHNGKTAKTRALTAKRVFEHKKKSNAGANAPVTVEALPREKKRREEKILDSSSAKPRKVAVTCPNGIDPQLWSDWAAVRTAKRAGPVTQTVLRSMTAEAAKAGITLQRAIEIAAARGWQAFKADWAWQDKSDEQPVSRYDYLTE